MMKKANEAKTAAELKADLKILKKRIEEKKREELLKPFLPMIQAATKDGKLAQLTEACSRVVYGDNATVPINEPIVD